MSSTVPLSVTVEVKLFVMRLALSAEYVKMGFAEVEVTPNVSVPDLREIFVTTVMYLLAINVVLLSMTLTMEMADVGTDIVICKPERKRSVFAVNSSLVMYLHQHSKRKMF